MKTFLSQSLNPLLRSIEADVLSRMAVIFRCCQHLVGFTLEESAEQPDDADPSGERGLFVSDIQFSHRVTDDETREACMYINQTVAEMIAESDESLNLLRDRTFARALH